MADEADIGNPKRKKGLLVPLLIGVVLAIATGAGGFWAVTQGPFASASAVDDMAASGGDGESAEMAPVSAAFIELETLIIPLGPDEADRNLIFSASLEVGPDHLEEVTQLTPRVLDVLNSYLRVISVSELSEPTSLSRLRSQMLRRIQVVTGTGRVRDLLVTQFLVN